MSEKKIFDPYYFETSVNQHNYPELLMTFYVKHHGVKDYKKYYFNKMVVHLFYKFGSTVIIHSHPKESGFGFWICNESFSNSFILSRTHSILKKNEKKWLGFGFHTQNCLILGWVSYLIFGVGMKPIPKTQTHIFLIVKV